MIERNIFMVVSVLVLFLGLYYLVYDGLTIKTALLLMIAMFLRIETRMITLEETALKNG